MSNLIHKEPWEQGRKDLCLDKNASVKKMHEIILIQHITTTNKYCVSWLTHSPLNRP